VSLDSPARARARQRRSTGASIDFDGKRLSLARRLRRVQRTTLAGRTSVTAAAITQFERGVRPTNAVAAELALALGVPVEFFQQGLPIPQVPTGGAHFRSLRATPAISRDQALAFAEVALAVVDVLEQYVDLPELADLIDPVDEDATEQAVALVAGRARSNLAVGPGPVAHVVRLLEAHGAIVLRLPAEVDPRVDAFSTDAGSRPLVLLSPLKNDRARSRFDAAHELGHLVMHQDVTPGSKTVERQAHQFAAEFLAPTDELEPDLPRKVDWDQLVRVKQKWGLSLAALTFRAHALGLWSEHSYRRANQHLRAAGYPEQGPLGPPESPTLIGAAVDLLAGSGTSVEQLARASRLTVEQITDVVQAGSDTKPRLRLSIEPG